MALLEKDIVQEPLQKFGQFLVTRGVVNEEAVINALNLQKERTLPIGKIALREKLLSVKQVFHILNEQGKNYNNGQQGKNYKLFGQIAVELGYLTEQDVRKLLEIQQKSRPLLGELLVEIGALSQHELERELAEYSRYVSAYI